MTIQSDVHPQKEQLAAFAVGKLESSAIDVIATHLDDCEECRQTLRDIPDDTFVTLVRDCQTIPDAHRAAEPSANAATILHSEVKDEGSTPGDEVTVAPSGQATAWMQQRLQLSAELAKHPRYDIVDVIGMGGMGAVYQAEHRMMKRTVALKVINPKLVANKSAVERFHREVQAAARLHHPNIVTAHDAEQAGDSHFLVMEYVQGVDLYQYVNEHGPLPVTEACEYIRQAALGLQHAHENGMVHRDIKPQNLMLALPPARSANDGPDRADKTDEHDNATEAGNSSLALRANMGIVKILDFGLASLATETVVDCEATVQEAADENQKPHLTQAGSIMGTPDYMAPEQANDAHAADIRADIYSLGCTLYFLLTGNVPFPDGTAVDKIIAHAERAPRPIRELRDDVPKTLVELLDRMTAKEPEERYQTPAHVAEALASFARGESAQKRVPAQSPVFWVVTGVFAVFVMMQWLFGMPMLALIVGVLGALTLVFVGTAHKKKQKTVNRPRRRSTRRSATRWLVGTITFITILLLGGIIWIATDNGQLRIECKADDVQVVVSKGGEEYEVIDVKSGSKVTRLPSGEYKIALKGNRTDVKLSKDGFTMTRNGMVIVTVTPEPAAVKLDMAEYTRVVRAGRGQLPDEDKKKLLAENHPLLSQLADPHTKKIIELFANLPDGAHKDLQKSSYLKWKYTSLDEARQKVYHDSLKLNLDMAKKNGVKPPRTMSLEALKKADVGFAAVGIPELKTKVVSWYILLPEHPQPIWVTVVGVKAAGKQPYFAAHREQLPRLGEKPYTAVPGSMPAKNEITLVRKFEGHKGSVTSVAISRDGRFALTSSGFPKHLSDKTLRLWDMETGKQIRSILHEGPVHALAFSPDGNLVLSEDRNKGNIRSWNVDTGKELSSLNVGMGVQVITFSPNGDYLAAGGNHVRVWDWRTGDVIQEFKHHKSFITDVAFLPDGEHVVSGAWRDSVVRLWNVRTGMELRRFETAHTRCEAVAVSPQGHLLAVGGDSGIQIWEVKTGRQVRHWRGHGMKKIFTLSFSPDGKHVVSGGSGERLFLWHIDQDEPVAFANNPSGYIMDLAFTPDGRNVLTTGGSRLTGESWVSTGDFALRLWQLPEIVWPKETANDAITLVRKFAGHTRFPWFMVVSPDSRLVGSAGSRTEDPTVRIWERATGKLLHVLNHTQRIWRLAFSSDSRYLLSGSSDKRMILWDAREGQLIRSFNCGSNVRDNVFAFEGKWVVSAEQDGYVRVWDRQKGKQLYQLRTENGYPTRLAVMPDGKTILVGQHGKVLHWNPTADKILAKWKAPHAECVALAIDPRGKSVVAAHAGQKGFRTWDVPTGNKISDTANSPIDVWELQFSADGRHLLSSSGDRTILIWDTTTWNEVHKQMLSWGQAQSFRFTSDGQAVDCPCRNMDSPVFEVLRLRLPESVWPKETTKDEITLVRKFEGHTGPVKSVAISPDGKFALSGSGWPTGDGTVRLWNLSTGKEIRQFKGHSNQVMTVAFSPDGKRAASAGYDKTVHVWDVRTGEQLFTLKGHTAGVEQVVFSPDGHTLLSVGLRGEGKNRLGDAKLWDLQSGNQLWEFKADGWLMTGAFLPDGKGVIVAGFQKAADPYLIDPQTGRELGRFKQRKAGVHDVEEIVISPDGRIVTGVVSTGRIWLWNVETGEEIAEHRVDSKRLLAVAYSPDGDRLLVGGHAGVLHILDTKTWDEVTAAEHPSGSVWDIAISADGRHMLTAGGTKSEGPAHGMKLNGDYALRLWQLPESVSPKNVSLVDLTLKTGGPNLKMYLDGREYLRANDVVAEITKRVKKNPTLEVRMKGDVDPDDRYVGDLVNLIRLAGVKNITFPPAAVQKIKDGALRLMRINNLKQIGIALHGYHDANESFPPGGNLPAKYFDKDGKPLLSWRVYILPYLEQLELFQKFRLDEPWDSKHNIKLLGEMPKVFKSSDDKTKTTILAVVGKGTAYEGKRGLSLPSIANGDGASNTIYAVMAGSDKVVPWTKPQDLPFDSDDPARMLGNMTGKSFLALFCNSAVREVRIDQKPASLRALFTRNGKEAPAAELWKRGEKSVLPKK